MMADGRPCPAGGHSAGVGQRVNYFPARVLPSAFYAFGWRRQVPTVPTKTPRHCPHKLTGRYRPVHFHVSFSNLP